MSKLPLSDRELREIERGPEFIPPPLTLKAQASAQIQADIERFLAAGGKIQQIDCGHTTTTSTEVDVFSIYKGKLPNTIHTASVFLGIHHATLRHGIRRGYLPDGRTAPQHRRDKRGVYFTYEDLMAWKQAQEQNDE